MSGPAGALLDAHPENVTTPAAVRSLHLGATGAGNNCAVACAEALVVPSCPLAVLCLSGDVGDVGARAIATVLGKGCALRELYIGNKIGDLGVEKLCGVLGAKESPNKLEVLCLGGMVLPFSERQ